MRISGSRIAVPFITCVLCAPISAQVTQRASLDSSGAQGDDSSAHASISDDARFVAFFSAATNLVPGDTNAAVDLFLRDRQTGLTSRESVSSAGVQANDRSFYGRISADGRSVVFISAANNLVPGDTQGMIDVFVRDLSSGQTTRVSVSSAGIQGNSDSTQPFISADGRYVVFTSDSDNLAPGDTNGQPDVFVRDRSTGQTSIVSVDSAGAQSNAASVEPSISADGRFVWFVSVATNLVAGDTNAAWDIFLRDRQTNQTTLVSVDSSGVQGDGNSDYPSLSADGRLMAFESWATNLVAGDTNSTQDIFVHDFQSGLTSRVSVDSAGGEANDFNYHPSISADGRYVAFASVATNLVPGDTNANPDIFVHDLQTGRTERVNVDLGGGQANHDSEYASISSAGRCVTFDSRATNLVQGDTNGCLDVFVADRNVTGFSSLCDPGAGGVAACPCSNPPSGSGRGCDNSAATGGAALAAAGMAYLSMDSLLFTTTGERATAFSILMQGNALLTNGVVYGQGVRCVGGAIKRLFAKSAVAGSITAPDFGVGDATVSAQSAAKGDVIQPGQSRWYLVYYRDPIVLGGCSASSTFNATQTGQVTWSP